MDLKICSYLWAIFFAVWVLAAFRVKRDKVKEAFGSRAIHVTCLYLSMALIFSPSFQPQSWALPFAPSLTWLLPFGVAITALGHAFAVRARVHLGKNWSGRVVLKEDHQLITSGPYRFVRHPIYTGILTAQLGSAIASGDYKGFIGVALFTAAYIRKIRMEEKVLSSHFGTAWADFKAHTRALIPFIF